MLSLKKKTAKPELRLVVDNRNPVTGDCRSRLGLMRDFLKKVRVISNGPFVPRLEREAMELAAWIEDGYYEYMSRNVGEPDATIHVVQLPDENVRKAAIELLRSKRFSVTFTEIRNRPGGRFTVRKVIKHK